MKIKTLPYDFILIIGHTVDLKNSWLWAKLLQPYQLPMERRSFLIREVRNQGANVIVVVRGAIIEIGIPRTAIRLIVRVASNIEHSPPSITACP
jgi:hypothetical protein